MPCRFSIVIPLYNKQGYIRQALDSVAEQTFTDYEVIVVDDGSTDQSLAELKAYRRLSVKIIEQVNSGAAAARNAGVRAATGEYLAFLDADDVWLKSHLAVFDALIREYPQARLFTSAFTLKHWRGGRWEYESNSASKPGVVDFFFELQRYFLCINSVVVHRESFLETHGFAEGYRHGEDWAPLMEMGLRHASACSTEVTSVADRNVAGQTTRAGYAAGELRFLGYLPVLAREFRTFRSNPTFEKYARSELQQFFISRVSWGYFHEFAKIYLGEHGRDAVPERTARFYDLMLRHVWLQRVVANVCRGLRRFKRVARGQTLSDIASCPCQFYRWSGS